MKTLLLTIFLLFSTITFSQEFEVYESSMEFDIEFQEIDIVNTLEVLDLSNSNEKVLSYYKRSIDTHRLEPEQFKKYINKYYKPVDTIKLKKTHENNFKT